MILTSLEKNYLYSVYTVGGRDLGGATLPAVARALGWSDKDFIIATHGLRHFGYILVTGALIALSPLGRNEIGH